MSKTYRKYPTYRYKTQGTYYNDLDDLPTVTKKRRKYKRVTRSHMVWEYIIGRRAWNEETVPCWAKKVEKKYIERVPDGWEDYEQSVPAELHFFYGEKTYREGWNNQRVWRSQGVGKDWKRLREKKTRAGTREAIHRCMKGFEDETLFPLNKTTDRWDYW